MDIYWAIDTDAKAGVYDQCISEKCAWCGAYIIKDLNRYILHGNSCLSCVKRFNLVSNGVREVNPDGSYKKIRDYTEEEKMDMLIDRLSEVKEKGLYLNLCVK